VAYVQSVAASAKDTGKKVEAAASALTLVVAGIAWWRYGVAWGLVVFLMSLLVVVIRAGLRQQRAIEQLSDSATPMPLQSRYDHGSETYHHAMDGQPGVFEHRVGLLNPGILTVHGVRMALLGMEPWPRHNLNNMDPVTHTQCRCSAVARIRSASRWHLAARNSGSSATRAPAATPT
jgi:hypothetical protein